jgi:hypothetical protein
MQADFGTIMGALVAGHYLADYWVQTDHQAQHKGLTGPRSAEGRWNCAKHAATYTLTLAATVYAAVSVSGLDMNHGVLWAALASNGVTHYLIDRRWTLEAFARATGKGGWIDADKSALGHLDQAAHLSLLGAVALVVAGLG